MASFAASIEDPEKHFLGDLLSGDDDVFAPASPRRDATLPSAAPLAPPGPLGPSVNSAFWPEPPPPYTPSLHESPSWPYEVHHHHHDVSDAPPPGFAERRVPPDRSRHRTEPAYAPFNEVHVSSEGEPHNFVLPLPSPGRERERAAAAAASQQWDDVLRGAEPFFPQINTRTAQPRNLQVHHHHHTHTHNVVNNHHHHIRLPLPEGMAGHAPYQLQHGYADHVDHDGGGDGMGVVSVGGGGGGRAVQRPASGGGGEPPSRRPPQHRHIEIHHHEPLSAPPMTNKLPFSYRDVANRGAGSVGAAMLHKGVPGAASSASQSSTRSGGSVGEGGGVEKADSKEQLDGGGGGGGDEWRKKTKSKSVSVADAAVYHHVQHQPPNDFQKIQRKKSECEDEETLKEASVSQLPVSQLPPAPVKKEKSGGGGGGGGAVKMPAPSEVTVESRFDVLQKLAAARPTARSDKKNGHVSRAAAIPVAVSRSSSVADEESGSGRMEERALGGGADKRRSSKSKRSKKEAEKEMLQKKPAGKNGGGGRKKGSTVWDWAVLAVSWVCLCVERGARWLAVLCMDVWAHASALCLYGTRLLVVGSWQQARLAWLATLAALAMWMNRAREATDWRSLLDGSVEGDEMEECEWGCDENIDLPTDASTVVSRLLSVPLGADAYCVLGVRADCAEADIKRHYKRLSQLVHPDKFLVEYAEEACAVLARAHELVGEPAARAGYNLTQLHKNKGHLLLLECQEELRLRWEEARGTMQCDCGSRHSRRPVPGMKQHEARWCERCETRHPAKQNDIWAETRLCGLVWCYYTCIDGVVYDITHWATCESNHLRNARANAHSVQYRLLSSSPLMHDEGDMMARAAHSQMSLRAPMDEDKARRMANRRQRKMR